MRVSSRISCCGCCTDRCRTGLSVESTGNRRPFCSHSHAMAYDVQRDLVAETGPSPRMGHAMFYDSRRGAVILFGGNDGAPPERHMGVGRPGMETPFHIRSLPSFKACSSLRFRSWSGGSLWRHSKRAGRYLGVGRQLLENRRCFRA